MEQGWQTVVQRSSMGRDPSRSTTVQPEENTRFRETAREPRATCRGPASGTENDMKRHLATTPQVLMESNKDLR